MQENFLASVCWASKISTRITTLLGRSRFANPGLTGLGDVTENSLSKRSLLKWCGHEHNSARCALDGKVRRRHMATYEHSIILIGPHSEEKAVELIIAQLKSPNKRFYDTIRARIDIPAADRPAIGELGLDPSGSSK